MPHLDVIAHGTDPTHRLLHRGVVDLAHALLLLPVLQESHPGCQRRAPATEPLRLGQLDYMQLQLLTQAHSGLLAVAQFETPEPLMLILEQPEVQQVDGDGRFEACVVLAVQELPGEGAREVVGAAGGPGALGTDLHLDVVELAVGVAGEEVEDDQLAREVLGADFGVQDLDDSERGLGVTDGVDEFGEQVWGAGEEALEDGVVFGIEKWGGVHAGDSFRGLWRGGCRIHGTERFRHPRCLFWSLSRPRRGA